MADTNGNLARKKSGAGSRNKSTADAAQGANAKKAAGEAKAAVAKKTAADIAAIGSKAGEPSKMKLWYDSVVRFFKSIKGEMERVTWPSGKELRLSTIVVVVTLVMVSLYMGIVDWVLSLLFGTPSTGF